MEYGYDDSSQHRLSSHTYKTAERQTADCSAHYGARALHPIGR
jgi:hypothetical protein